MAFHINRFSYGNAYSGQDQEFTCSILSIRIRKTMLGNLVPRTAFCMVGITVNLRMIGFVHLEHYYTEVILRQKFKLNFLSKHFCCNIGLEETSTK